ncbi:C-C motif chemokine 4 homolog [Astyanax mexicanus]|uniref:C-C motif chemokine 4 homolog n=1 Tax=Astyanax mexicanus TaxID=7994 RepID=UPI0020CB5E6D|nr:C-C motif chemokine 4 homolog [Astyanax mexicanus]
MRSGSALLLVLLLGSLQLSSSAPAGTGVADCCFKFTTVKKIPLRIVESYTETHSDCALKAIVFIMKTKGNKFCVHPDAEWVKSHVAALDRRNNTATAKPSTANSTTLSTTKLL